MHRLLLLSLLALTLGACALMQPEVVSEDNRVWVRRGPVLLRCADLTSEGRPQPVCVVADGAAQEETPASTKKKAPRGPVGGPRF